VTRQHAAAVLLLCLGLLGQCPSGRAEELSEKEAFMLMFGKGNGAMRVLCALQRDGVIDQATRLRWLTRLETALHEPGDSPTDRRNTRIGMAFADRRSNLCPQRLMGQTNP
jgi:hypothetical protein